MEEANLEKIAEHHNRQEQAYKLVGRFLHRFAHMEAELDGALAAALRLNLLQQVIVASNIIIANKVNIVKAAVLVSSIETGKRKHYIDELDRLFGLIDDRNIAAHHIFGPPVQGQPGVEFLTSKAKPKLKMEAVVWSPADFENRVARLDHLAAELKALATDFKLANRDQIMRELARIESIYAPMPTPGPQAPEFCLDRPFREDRHPDQNSATPQTDGQTPAIPEE